MPLNISSGSCLPHSLTCSLSDSVPVPGRQLWLPRRAGPVDRTSSSHRRARGRESRRQAWKVCSMHYHACDVRGQCIDLSHDLPLAFQVHCKILRLLPGCADTAHSAQCWLSSWAVGPSEPASGLSESGLLQTARANATMSTVSTPYQPSINHIAAMQELGV